MKRNKNHLTKTEREILILTAKYVNGKFLSNAEISQISGIPISKVKSLIHTTCLKLGAHSRNEAIIFALRRGDLVLTDLWSLNYLAGIFNSLGPYMLKRIANMLRQGQDYKHLQMQDKQPIIIGKRQNGILTERERDVVILAGLGHSNKEIANRLYITIGSVSVFLNRAYSKLGVCKRSEAFTLALRKREISIVDVYTLNELVAFLAPLGAEAIEEMALLLSDNKFEQEPLETANSQTSM